MKARTILLVAVLSACRGAKQSDGHLHGKRSGKEIRETWEAERRKEASRYTDADLRRMVEKLFVEGDPESANLHGLMWAEKRAVPFLIEALSWPRTQSTVFHSQEFYLEGGSPFDRICSILQGTAPTEAAAPLAKYLNHADPAFRRAAAMVLARIACAECLGPVKTALTDRDREVRTFALMGLAHGWDRPERNQAFFAGIFPALIPLLKDGSYSTVAPAAILTEIDAARAVPILESPEYFTTRNPQLGQVLGALNRETIKVPRAILMPLIEELEQLGAKDRARESDYAAALILYARNPDEHAHARLQALLQAQTDFVAEAAATGLEILAGIDSRAAVADAYEHKAFDDMPKPVRYYVAVQDYINEVNNGGHRQYFYNSDSGDYEVAIEGLKAIGAPAKAAILADSLKAFAPMHPSPDNDDRRDQMERLGKRQELHFSAADDRFYESEKRPAERLAVLLTLYALNHPSDFAAPKKVER
jgi:HEAT repeat protein